MNVNMLFEVGLWLDLESIPSFCRACKKFNSVIDDYYWYMRYKKDYGDVSPFGRRLSKGEVEKSVAREKYIERVKHDRVLFDSIRLYLLDCDELGLIDMDDDKFDLALEHLFPNVSEDCRDICSWKALNIELNNMLPYNDEAFNYLLGSVFGYNDKNAKEECKTALKKILIDNGQPLIKRRYVNGVYVKY